MPSQNKYWFRRVRGEIAKTVMSSLQAIEVTIGKASAEGAGKSTTVPVPPSFREFRISTGMFFSNRGSMVFGWRTFAPK